MRDLAKLLFGGDGGGDSAGGGVGGLFGLFGPGDHGESGMSDRVRRAREWCGSTPGSGSPADALRSAGRPRGPRRVIIREYRD
jgi:hypothetical protein